MPDPTHITVTAPSDRVTPIHKDDGIEPSGAQLRVRAGFVARVRYSQSVRRAIGRGDLIPCNMAGAAVPSVTLAAAADDFAAGPARPLATKADIDAVVDAFKKETR